MEAGQLAVYRELLLSLLMAANEFKLSTQHSRGCSWVRRIPHLALSAGEILAPAHSTSVVASISGGMFWLFSFSL